MVREIVACAIGLLLLTAASCSQDREDYSETRTVVWPDWIRTLGVSDHHTLPTDELLNKDEPQQKHFVSEPVSKPAHRKSPFAPMASEESKDSKRISEEHNQPTDNLVDDTSTPQAIAASTAASSGGIGNVDVRFILAALSAILLFQIATVFLALSARKKFSNNTAAMLSRELELLRNQFEEERQSLLKEISVAQDSSGLAVCAEQEKNSKLRHHIEQLRGALQASLAEQQRLSNALTMPNRKLEPQNNAGDVSYNSTDGLPQGFVNDSVIGNIIATGAAGFMER